MSTNLDLDPTLIESVRRAGHYRTKREAVTAALREHLAMLAQREALTTLGSIEFVPGWEDKATRRAAR